MAQVGGTSRRMPAVARKAAAPIPNRSVANQPLNARNQSSVLAARQAQGLMSRPSAAPAPPAPAPPPPPPSGGGRTGGGTTRVPSTNSRGNVRAPAAAPQAAPGPVPAVAPAVPDIESFLGGDVTYQSQGRQFEQALTDFLAGLTQRRGELEGTFSTANRELGQERERSLENIRNDFAARGLLESGLFGEANLDYEAQYKERVDELARQQAAAMAGLTGEETAFRGEQTAAREAARAEALRRRAEQYGV